jgi:hypothetical protein
MTADRRLRQEHYLSGAGEAAVLYDATEYLDLMKVHIRET